MLAYMPEEIKVLNNRRGFTEEGLTHLIWAFNQKRIISLSSNKTGIPTERNGYLGRGVSLTHVHRILFLSYAWLTKNAPNEREVIFKSSPVWSPTGFLFPETIKNVGMPSGDQPFRLPLSSDTIWVNANFLIDNASDDVVTLFNKLVEWMEESEMEIARRVLESKPWRVGYSEFKKSYNLFNPIDQDALETMVNNDDEYHHLLNSTFQEKLNRNSLSGLTQKVQLNGLYKEDGNRLSPIFTPEEFTTYVLEYTIENRSFVSNLKLQKILFLVNAKCIHEYGRQLMDGFEKGKFGAIHREMYKHCSYYGSIEISSIPFNLDWEREENLVNFHEKLGKTPGLTIHKINEWIDLFLLDDDWSLVNTTQNHPSWKRAIPRIRGGIYEKYELEELVEDIFYFEDFFKVDNTKTI